MSIEAVPWDDADQKLGRESIDHFLTRAANHRRPSLPSADLLENLRRYSAELPSDPSRDASLDQFARGAVAIVTGQQPGLFGGPLYTHFKIATALAMARALGRRGIQAVAIFWNASEDHDFDEANRFFFPTHRGDTVRLLRLPKRDVGARLADSPVSQSDVAILQGTVAAEGLAHASDDLPQSGDDFGRWMSRIIARHFSGQGLLIVEPRVLAPLAVPVWSRFIAEQERARQAMEPAALAARAAGDDRAASRLLERSVGVFAIDRGRRTAIIDRNGKLKIGRETFDRSVVLDRLRSEPHAFSSSVLSRPLVQQFTLGSAVQIVGPGEMRYLDDMRPLFAAFDIPAPILSLRVSGTIVDPVLAPALRRSGLTIDDVRGPTSTWPKPRHKVPDDWPGIAREIARSRNIAPTTDVLSASPTVAEILRLMAHGDATNVRRLDRRFRALWKKSFGRSALDRKIVEEMLLPRGRPQERTFGLRSFRSIFPREFVAELLRAIEADPRGRYLLITD